MINHADRTITQGGRVEPIARWEVWFRCPLGLCRSLAEAEGVCRTHEMPLQFSVIPVPVAIGDGSLYEEVPR